MAGSSRRVVVKGGFSGYRKRRITSGTTYFYGDCADVRRVDLGSQSSPGTDATVAFWIKRYDIGNDTLMSYGRMLLTVNATANQLTWFPDVFGSNQVLTLPADMIAGQWHHIAIVQDGTTALPYLDGVAGTLDASTPALNTSAGTSRLCGTGSSQANVAIRDFRMYDVPLDTADIGSVRTGCTITASPVHHLPFDDGSGTTVTATVGGNGTVSGSDLGEFWQTAAFPKCVEVPAPPPLTVDSSTIKVDSTNITADQTEN